MRILLFFLITLVIAPAYYSQTCNITTGNVIIFSNYDGGVININCDVNIPNLKIGVCTYEDCQINITGPFAEMSLQCAMQDFKATTTTAIVASLLLALLVFLRALVLCSLRLREYCPIPMATLVLFVATLAAPKTKVDAILQHKLLLIS